MLIVFIAFVAMFDAIVRRHSATADLDAHVHAENAPAWMDGCRWQSFWLGFFAGRVFDGRVVEGRQPSGQLVGNKAGDQRARGIFENAKNVAKTDRSVTNRRA